MCAREINSLLNYYKSTTAKYLLVLKSRHFSPLGNIKIKNSRGVKIRRFSKAFAVMGFKISKQTVSIYNLTNQIL